MSGGGFPPDPSVTNPVGQSGEVTPGHLVSWTTDGVVQDAGTSLTTGPFLPLSGGTLTGPLILAGDPTTALGAASKEYVDSHGGGGGPFLPLTGGTLTGPLTLNANPTTPLGAATKSYVDSGAFLPITGGTLTGPLILNANPTLPLGAATKSYVDSGAFLPLTGGTLTGRLTTPTLTILSTPISPTDGVNKAYVDGHLSGLPWVQPETYGAVADGVTDCTSAINAMIAAIPAGSMVFWRAGTYLVSSTITVGKSMTWVGSGRLATSITTSQASTAMLVFNAAVNISDMGFACSATATSGYMLTYNSGATRSRLERFWMINFFSGININAASDISLIDGQMFNWTAGGTGILYVGGLAALFDQLVMQQGSAPGNGNGIVIRNEGVTINNSQILSCGNALVLAPQSGQVVDSVWVENSGFDSSVNALLVQPATGGTVERCWFVGCWFGGSTQQGVAIEANSTLSSIDGLDFTNCHIFGNGQYGVLMTNANATNLKFQSCRIAGNTQYGLSFASGGQYFSIIGCTISAWGGFGSNLGGGINLGGGCSFYHIQNNDLDQSGVNPLVGAGVQSGPAPGVSEFINGNHGYVSQNRGQATIAAGNVSVTVAHGLSGTPRLQDIQLTNLTGMGNPPAVVPFVLSPTSSTFVIETGVATAFNIGVGWKAMLPCST